MFGVRAGPTAYVRALGNIRAQRGMKEAFVDGLVRAELYLPASAASSARPSCRTSSSTSRTSSPSFNPQAVSRAGAAGLWQFTRETFGHYDKTGGGADARFDPVRSTEVAALHLARARSVLGSWPLAVASYNYGVAGMARARAAVGVDALDDIVRGYDSALLRVRLAEFLRRGVGGRARREQRASLLSRHAAASDHAVRRSARRLLWTIARRHRVSVRDISAANNLDGSRLRTGQLLVITSG